MFSVIPLPDPLPLKLPGQRRQELAWAVVSPSGKAVAVFEDEPAAWAYAHRRKQLAAQRTA